MWRFIPAGAGNTRAVIAELSRKTVYPRWRGEHVLMLSMLSAIFGLSPLARGTRHGRCWLSGRRRFIPAGAGNTVGVFNSTSTVAGLSPLARGTPVPVRPPAPTKRFIPAGAGNTIPNRGRIPIGSVYPRWRGEHTAAGKRRNISDGLSPLARGTRSGHRQKNVPGRFIPAGAGNTVEGTAYPTRCTGLSPLARGTRKHQPR